MKIAIGSDHGGFLLKRELIKFLDSKKITVADMGTHSEESCDYPLYAKKVATAVANNEFDKGILICKSGIGMSMSANKVKGARAALCWDIRGAKSSRLHNNANVLCLGADKISLNLAKKIVGVWLATGFEGGRHLRRVKQMDKIGRH